jgi:hypothetical protein
MTEAPRLRAMMKRLLAMREGEAGILVRPQELMELELANIDEIDVRCRADWLRSQLPFPSEITASATTGDYGFRRLPPRKPPILA